MKRTVLYTLLIALLSLATSCDKIEQNEYIIPSGITGEWLVSLKDIPTKQCAMVEKYTGVRCVNCPTADEVIHAALDQYGDKLIAVAVHSGAFGRPLGNDPDLRNAKANEWYESLIGTGTGLPAAMINRGEHFNPIGGINDKVDAIVNEKPAVSMLMEKAKVNDKITADVHISFEEDVNQELTLTLLLTEDSIFTTQSRTGGDIEHYAQNHVLREIYTDVWGLPINVGKAKGMKYFISLPVSIPTGVVEANSHLVAFVSEKGSRRILNVVQCDL